MSTRSRPTTGRWATALRWASSARTAIIRVGSFYAGYRILHHEIYETDTAEPLLVFVGLWLCGIAPATLFDSLRRLGISLQNQVEAAASDTPHRKDSTWRCVDCGMTFASEGVARTHARAQHHALERSSEGEEK